MATTNGLLFKVFNNSLIYNNYNNNVCVTPKLKYFKINSLQTIIYFISTLNIKV